MLATTALRLAACAARAGPRRALVTARPAAARSAREEAPASFAELFAASPLYRAGEDLRGRLIQGTIVSAGRESVVVDLGLKFPATLHFGSDIHRNLCVSARRFAPPHFRPARTRAARSHPASSRFLFFQAL